MAEKRRSRVKEARDQQDAAQIMDVGQVMEELGEDATAVSLWRMNGAEEAYLDRVPAKEFTLDYVRKHPYGGGGRFRMRVSGQPDGKGVRKWIRTATFTIAGPPNGDAPTGGAAAARQQEQPMPWWGQVMLAMAPGLAAALASKLLESKPTDPILLALVERMGKGGDGPSSVEIQQLVETARTNGITLGEQLGNAKALAELPRGGESDGPLTTAIRELGPPLVEAMKSGREAPPRARATARLDNTTQQQVASGATPAWVARIKPFMRVILGWADSGKNATVKAMSVLDDLAEADQESLAASCESPTFMQDVFAWLPELSSTDVRREWFTTFLAAIQDALTEPDEEEDASDAGAEGGQDAGRSGPGGTAAADGGGAAGGGAAGGGEHHERGAGPGVRGASRVGGAGSGPRRPRGGGGAGGRRKRA